MRCAVEIRKGYLVYKVKKVAEKVQLKIVIQTKQDDDSSILQDKYV